MHTHTVCLDFIPTRHSQNFFPGLPKHTTPLPNKLPTWFICQDVKSKYVVCRQSLSSFKRRLYEQDRPRAFGRAFSRLKH